MIDQSRAAAAFSAYTSAYDPHNPRIALKIDHTLRVAQNCDAIARAEGLDADIAWLCGLLHDIGRFEQVRRFDTFRDADSVSHAALGVGILFGEEDPRGPQIRSFLSDAGYDNCIRDAIATHSAYRVGSTISPDSLPYCNVLRDADKIDIIEVNCICPIEDIYGVSQSDMENSELSPKVVETFYSHRTLPRNIRNYPADVLIGHICFAWELVYPSSRELLVEQGYIFEMLSRRFALPKTQEQFEDMGQHMRQWLNQKGDAR